MLFNSLQFLAFYIIVGLGFILVKRNTSIRNTYLLIVSYLFYAAWDWRFLGLILLSTVVDYFIALRLETNRAHSGRLVFASLFINLGILGIFKYLDFGIISFSHLLIAIGLQPHLATLSIILPVGISFYTFQTIGYTMDVAAERRTAVRNFRDFALFVTYFPQLVAGPIERSSVLLPQLQSPTVITWDHMRRGLLWVLTGYFLKVIAADSVAPLVNEAFAHHKTIGGPVLFMATWGFAVQIFGDFAGYTLIARGISEWFGIRLMENFRSPYLSLTPREFWQRWHISLSTWFQQYLYTPIALSFARRGWKGQQTLPIILTMTIIGLWHGAGWHFVVFGFYWGFLLAAHTLYLQKIKSLSLRNPTHLLSRFQRSKRISIITFKGACLFFLTLVSFVLFRSPNLTTAVDVLLSWFTDWHMDPSLPLYIRTVGILFGIIWIYGWIQNKKKDPDFLLQSPEWLRWTVYFFILLSLLTIGFRPVPFIYFQF